MNTRDILMRFPGGVRKAVTLSYDDGVEQDARLIALMKENGFKGTFNLSSALFAPEGYAYAPGTIHRRMSASAARALYDDPDIEVAIHGARHLHLTQLPAPAAVAEIVNDRIGLENMFGRVVRGMAYAYGALNDQCVDILRLCGVAYARTVISSHGFALPRDWLRLEATCHHRDPALGELAETFRQYAPADGSGEPRLFYLWGHAYEFESADNWHVIEGFLSGMRAQPDTWYATNIDIYEYVRAFEGLVYSADGTRVFNPGCRPVWLWVGGRVYEVEPGGQKQLF